MQQKGKSVEILEVDHHLFLATVKNKWNKRGQTWKSGKVLKVTGREKVFLLASNNNYSCCESWIFFPITQSVKALSLFCVVSRTANHPIYPKDFVLKFTLPL